jgi:hypothetical protein
MRYGLQKHVLKTRKEDIINCECYKDANDMFQGVLVKLKQSGLGETQHKEPIDPEDLAKLYDSAVFSDSNVTGLH